MKEIFIRLFIKVKADCKPLLILFTIAALIFASVVLLDRKNDFSHFVFLSLGFLLSEKCSNVFYNENLENMHYYSHVSLIIPFWELFLHKFLGFFILSFLYASLSFFYGWKEFFGSILSFWGYFILKVGK